MGYDKYKDTNGVTWQVRQTGWNMLAYVADDASPRYDPPATDQQQGLPPPDDTGSGVAEPTGEQQRVMFTALAADIENFAKQHRGNTLLNVTASPPIPWWVWLGLGWLLLKGKK